MLKQQGEKEKQKEEKTERLALEQTDQTLVAYTFRSLMYNLNL